jgi:hypothetical protein
MGLHEQWRPGGLPETSLAPGRVAIDDQSGTFLCLNNGSNLAQ